jgi:Flp pilus assembly protein TadG
LSVRAQQHCSTAPARARLHAAARDERGVSLVEFALVLPVLALLLFGMLDFGKAFNYWIDATHLANEGARWAVVNKNPGSGAGQSLQEYIQTQGTTAELVNGGTASVPSPAAVCISFPSGTANVGDPVKVEVKLDYYWLPIIGNQIKVVKSTIRGTSTMRLEAKPSSYTAGGAC